MQNIIFHHEDWQRADIRSFLSPHWRQWQGGELPPFPVEVSEDGLIVNEIAEVEAVVNHGRWIASCPASCGNAIVVSQREPWYICTDCGSEENGGQWYRVVFPEEKAEIEAALTARSAKRPFQAPSRNWTPGETVKDLKAENLEHGVRV